MVRSCRIQGPCWLLAACCLCIMPKCCTLHLQMQGTSTATRVLVEESAWARQAEEKLRTWRASLFGRMATQYKELERKHSNNGSLLVGR